MATKCIVIGSESEKNSVPIELSKLLSDSLIIRVIGGDASAWSVLELICKDYGEGYDLIFAHDGVRSEGTLFLGHWNDGVV